jgi:hypothetical protein
VAYRVLGGVYDEESRWQEARTALIAAVVRLEKALPPSITELKTN